MKKKEIWLLSVLISTIMAVEGWGFFRDSPCHFLGTVPLGLNTLAVTGTVPSISDSPCHFLETVPLGLNTLAVTGTVPRTLEKLELELLGTAMSNIKEPIAFIKDLKTGKQGLYRKGSLIRGAGIAEISMGEVVFERNGQREVLRLSKLSESVSNNIERETSAIVIVSPDQIKASKGALLNDAANLYKSLRKAKIKPFYQSDEVVGLIIDGITQGSIIEAAGIRNKDIITTVNNQKIDSYQKALEVLRKVRNQPEIKVSLLRDGEIKMLSYQFGR